jgi:cyclopropane fatty-acyl-phospholipid synthase-like methyltransferase
MVACMTSELLREALTLDRYPRSNTYDQQWIVDNLMGPHPLWSTEALMQVMMLEPGMRVLDLGCGTALTSIFLAREYDVDVWATDLWVDPTENWERIKNAGVADRVSPIQADAHKLPYSHGFFDAIVSIGAYNYFGTSQDYLATCVELLKPSGVLGVVVPGIRQAPNLTPPPYLAERWGSDLCTWLPPDWWRNHWERTGLVTVETADMIPNGWQDWLHWLKTCAKVNRGYTPDEQMLEADQNTLLGLTRLVAHKQTPTM